MTGRVIAWSVLVRAPTTDDLWAWLTGAAVPYEPTLPTHPDAASAVTGGGYILEMSEQSVPVLWEGPGVERFTAASLLHRKIGGNEIGNTSLPFDYAVYLAEDTTPEQRSVLADGVVTFADN